MRCDEVLDQLPLLVYDELSADEAAACRQHLDTCPACRAELAALGQVRDALDRAPHRQVQVDLAAVCLRIVARERRDRVWRRIAVGITAAAAGLLALASLRLLNIAIEPGRLTVAWSRQAWQHAPVQSPTEGGSPAIRASHDASSLVTTSPTTEPRSGARGLRSDNAPMFNDGAFDGALLGGFAARRTISPGQAEALRYAQPAQLQTAPRHSATNYHDLRLELLAPRGHASIPGEDPDA